jgi:hypothetical protein
MVAIYSTSSQDSKVVGVASHMPQGRGGQHITLDGSMRRIDP